MAENPALAFERLVSWFPATSEVWVAFSGGIDSTLVLAAAQSSAAGKAIALVAVSPSLPESELRSCHSLAETLGIELIELYTQELQNKDYTRNDNSRCYHCKNELYLQIAAYKSRNIQDYDRREILVVDGLTADDRLENRPGYKAAVEAGIKHPLRECGFTKPLIRQVARHIGLPNWDKAAMACLASRIPTGLEVTSNRLRLIELGEDILKQLGLVDVRIRLHESLRGSGKDTIARIEVPSTYFGRVILQYEEISAKLKGVGFDFITLDLEGYREGGVSLKQ